MTEQWVWQIVISLLLFAAAYCLVRYAWRTAQAVILRTEQRLDVALNKQLLLDVNPRLVLGLFALMIVVVGLLAGAVLAGVFWFVIGAAAASTLPFLIIRHLEDKRRKRLDEQLVDGITTLASGVRAGLTLIQSMELLVQNHRGAIQQEFQQLLREYQLGVDLSQAMGNTANRIGSSYYRLVFSAIQAHRQRGGDVGESLDRISDSVREIQRLEGRLTALTAQGRAQARMMAAFPVVILAIMYFIRPDATSFLVTEPSGRLILLIGAAMIGVAIVWIRRIMQVDI